MPLRYSHNINNKSHFLLKIHTYLLLSKNFLVQCLARKVYPSQFEFMVVIVPLARSFQEQQQFLRTVSLLGFSNSNTENSEPYIFVLVLSKNQKRGKERRCQNKMREENR